MEMNDYLERYLFPVCAGLGRVYLVELLLVIVS